MKQFILADADVRVRVLMREILKQLDDTFHLISTGDAQGFLKQLALYASAPHLILLDPIVRFVDPADLIRRIKSDPAHMQAPLVLWTQFPNRLFEDLGQLPEVSAVYVKSYQPSEFKRTIREMLNLFEREISTL